jgi:hypothetical protein
MLQPQALAQDKGVLRPDSQNQGQAQGKAGKEGGHMSKAPSGIWAGLGQDAPPDPTQK